MKYAINDLRQKGENLHAMQVLNAFGEAKR